MHARAKITLILFLFCLCASSSLLYWHFRHQEQHADPTELFEAVESQLKAFRERNFPTAYDLASSDFRSQWSLEQFTSMARGDFPRIFGAERVEFGPWHRQGRRAMIQVFFVNHDGGVSPCIYSLISEGTGWKVDRARWVRGWPEGQRMRGIRS